jgi:hypothetical protein
MALQNVLAFIAVRDIEAGILWYKMLLGREPDTQPMKGWLNGTRLTLMIASSSSKKRALNLNRLCGASTSAWSR